MTEGPVFNLPTPVKKRRTTLEKEYAQHLGNIECLADDIISTLVSLKLLAEELSERFDVKDLPKPTPLQAYLLKELLPIARRVQSWTDT